jgi:uncharacterized protein with GYD domain
MPDTHVVLLTFNDAGRDGVRNGRNPTQRFAQDLERHGGCLLSLHLTLGAYDAVAIIELDSAKLPAFRMFLAPSVGVPQIMRAFSWKEVRNSLADWSGIDPRLGP